MSKDKKNRKTQILVALIGLVGVLIATVVSNWETTTKETEKNSVTVQTVTGSNSNIITNNSGEVNVKK